MTSSFAILGFGIVGVLIASYYAQFYLPPPTPKIVGIDLGTTYSSIAVYHAVTGEVEVIADEDGRKSIASVVGYLKNGSVVVGEKALRQSEHNPTRTIYDSKRFIGKSFADERGEFAEETKRYPFKILLREKQPYFVLDEAQRKVVTPVEIGAQILKHLKQMAERKLQMPIDKAVISVPAEFDELQRNATVEAAKLAGLHVYRLINEPTAAALAYGLHKKAGVDHVLIVDLGGGTLDVSLLMVQGGMLITRSTAGNNHLGGQDFTQRLFLYLQNQAREQFGKDLIDKDDLQNLRLASENAKLALTSAQRTTVDLELPSLASDARLIKEISRHQFELLNEDLFAKILRPIEAALDDAGATKDDVDEVVLVGGSTRIPRLRQIIADYFKKTPNFDVDPELAVVTGVAVQSGVITGGWPLQVSAVELPSKLRKIHVYD